jgi:hypothetical protein
MKRSAYPLDETERLTWPDGAGERGKSIPQESAESTERKNRKIRVIQ